ncbi:conserved hypothetical protein [Vibrio chagasii]|nr:conserved hypothetical protein [Vibrio chagasii]CAH7303001.1 conserved hypothetical protein [Vibrio chagasii]
MKTLVISTESYVNALKKLIKDKKLSDNHIKMFNFHYHSKDFRTTTRKIGEHLGYYGNGANGLIGSFSVMIAEVLQVEPVEKRKADNSPMWFSVIYAGEKPKDEHFTFEMRPEFVAALEQLELVQRSV